MADPRGPAPQTTRSTATISTSIRITKNHAEQLAKIVNAGGRIGLGSHGELQGLGVHWELWMMASGGMKPHDVLRAATYFGADAIGHAKDLGTLEVGKLADLQVLDANPSRTSATRTAFGM